MDLEGKINLLENQQIDDIQSVVFSLEKQLYSVLVEEVVEVLRVPSITTVPGINPMIEGVINLRGNIIPVLNLHKRFNLAIPKKNKKNRIVIVQGANENIGLMVEEVWMVTKFDEKNVEHKTNTAIEDDIFLGYAKMNGQVIGILNLHKVL
jgi:purine-binding chemotaxis protein CheW